MEHSNSSLPSPEINVRQTECGGKILQAFGESNTGIGAVIGQGIDNIIALYHDCLGRQYLRLELGMNGHCRAAKLPTSKLN